MKETRTDLAMEASALQGGADVPGVRVEKLRLGEMTETVVEVVDERGAAALGKPCGRYVTLESGEMEHAGSREREIAEERLVQTLSSMLPDLGEVLVVGLGNRYITADSLGPKVTEGVMVTRHLRQNVDTSLRGKLRSVSAMAPGVLGVTGLETAEVIRGVVEHSRPEAVIAVDALAAREAGRICTTLQIADTGIIPGSGVGNHRMGLDRETLGVPVIALGVPMVVYASAIARDALEILTEDFRQEGQEMEGAIENLLEKVRAGGLGEMVVTPRDVDERVQGMATLLSRGINRALQSRLSEEEIQGIMHGM